MRKRRGADWKSWGQTLQQSRLWCGRNLGGAPFCFRLILADSDTQSERYDIIRGMKQKRTDWKIPYVVSDFRRIRNEGCYYVD